MKADGTMKAVVDPTVRASIDRPTAANDVIGDMVYEPTCMNRRRSKTLLLNAMAMANAGAFVYTGL